MPAREKIVCPCGGELTRPLPKNCPHCGALIVGARRSVWPLVWPAVVVILMFAALVGFLLWLVGGQE